MSTLPHQGTASPRIPSLGSWETTSHPFLPAVPILAWLTIADAQQLGLIKFLGVQGHELAVHPEGGHRTDPGDGLSRHGASLSRQTSRPRDARGDLFNP